MDEEPPVELVEPVGRDLAPGRLDAALEHDAGAVADHLARLGERHGRQPFAAEDDVQGGGEVRRGVGEGAVEVEDDQGGRAAHEVPRSIANAFRPVRSKRRTVIDSKELSMLAACSGRPGLATERGAALSSITPSDSRLIRG